MSGFWWAFISPFLLWNSFRIHWQDSSMWRAACEAADTATSLNRFWSFLCVYFTHFSPVPPYPFSSITPCILFLLLPLFIFARQIKKNSHEVFLCNFWGNDSKGIFQNISKILVMSTAITFQTIFSHGDKNVCYLHSFQIPGATESRETYVNSHFS